MKMYMTTNDDLNSGVIIELGYSTYSRSSGCLWIWKVQTMQYIVNKNGSNDGKVLYI